MLYEMLRNFKEQNSFFMKKYKTHVILRYMSDIYKNVQHENIFRIITYPNPIIIGKYI